MKNLLIVALFFVTVVSCKKEEISQSINSSQSDNNSQKQKEYLKSIKKYLKDNLSKEDFKNIDLNKTIATKFDNGNIYLFRVQFRNPGNEFILIRMDKLVRCSKGMILNIKSSSLKDETQLSRVSHLFNGDIIVSSLTRQKIKDLNIKNGYKERKGLATDMAPPDDYYDAILPDVIVTAYISSQGGGTSYSDWFNLLNFYSPGDLGLDGGSSGGYYSPVDPYSGNTGGGSPIEDPKVIEYEDVESLEAISVANYMRCFDNIPDNEATCSIEIFTDLPVNGEPNTFFDWNTNSPGHSFLQIKKNNGTQSIQQNIGFYPNQGWKTMFYTPVTGKFADNGGHEFNASLKMSLSPEQLHSVITEIENISASASYDIDQYNCTDFALQVFNFVRSGNELIIPLYIIPGETLGIQSKTPQGLYQKLWSIKEAGGSEAANITIPGTCSYVGASNGPCN